MGTGYILIIGQAIGFARGKFACDGFALRLNLRVASHFLHSPFEFFVVLRVR